MTKISPKDKIEHLLIVDIQFDLKTADEKKILLNKIYSHIFEKNKCLDSSERSIFQLIETMQKADKASLNSYKYNKENTRKDEKKIIPLYVKYFRFSIKRSGWLVT